MADSIEWDFGDGSVGEGFEATHVYTQPGAFNVTCTARNAGGSKSITKQNYVAINAVGAPEHTLYFQEMFNANEDVTSSNLRGFTSVEGVASGRRAGPRNNDMLEPPGWSAVVYGPDASVNDAPAFIGRKQLIGSIRDCGVAGMWFRVKDAVQTSMPVFGLSINPDGVSQVCHAVVNNTSFQGDDCLLKMQDGITPTPQGSFAFKRHQWIWAATGWEQQGDGKTHFQLWAKTLGGVMTLVFESDSDFAGDIRPNYASIQLQRGGGIYPQVTPPTVRVGSFSIYETTELADAGIYPSDIIAPRENVVHEWFVDEVNGDDDNEGISEEEAWQTWAKVRSEAIRGTLLGHVDGFHDSDLNNVGMSTITDETTQDAFVDGIEEGEYVPAGDRLTLLTDLHAVPGDSHLTFEGLESIWIRGINSTVRLSNMFDITLETFTRPSPIDHPLVWMFTGTNLLRFWLIQGNVLTNRVSTTDTETAWDLLQAGTEGSSWGDEDGIYFTTQEGTDPNTDGVNRKGGVYVTPDGAGTGIISIKTGMISDLTLECGPVIGQETSVQPQYCASRVGGGLAVFKNLLGDGGNNHTFGTVGAATDAAGMEGLSVTLDCKYRGLYTHGGSIHDVMYNGLALDAGGCDLRGVWRRCGKHVSGAWHAPGEQVSNITRRESYHSHTAGSLSAQFYSKFIDCDFDIINPSRHHDNGFIYRGGSCEEFKSDGVGTLLDQSTLTTPRIQVFTNDTTIRNTIIKDLFGITYGSAHPLGGILDLDWCTVDLRNYGFGGVASASVITKQAGGNRVLRIKNSIIIATAAGIARFITGMEAADTILFDHCAFLGHATPIVFSWDDGGGADDYTYAQAVTAGKITNSSVSAGILLDSNYRPLAGCTAFNRGLTTADFPDHTGNTFANRTTAGAFQLSA